MWLKADLHLHTNAGPDAFVHWSPEESIDRAATAGFQVLSFTDHDTLTYTPALARYARDRGIVLIPGVEATVEGRHVLLYNFRCPPSKLQTFAGIRSQKEPGTLVVAPHPFFPGPLSLRRRLLDHLDLFDAIEYSHFYCRWFNWNRQGQLAARRSGLPLLGGSDAHLPLQFGTTYSLIEVGSFTPRSPRAQSEGGMTNVEGRIQNDEGLRPSTFSIHHSTFDIARESSPGQAPGVLRQSPSKSFRAWRAWRENSNFSVGCDPDLEGVLNAIRAGRVRVVSRPLKFRVLCAIALSLTVETIMNAGCVSGFCGRGISPASST